VAVETATFAVELEDGTSGPANAAASSLEDLKGKIDDDVKALREMQRALRNLKGGSNASASAVKSLESRISAQKASVSSSQDAFLKLGGTFGKTTPKVAGLAGNVSKLGGALGASSGPLAAVGGNLSKLGPLLANPAGLALALAAAFVALSVAAVALAAKLLSLGVAASGLRRDEALAIEGANTLRTAFGRTTASVAEFQNAIDNASDSTNIGRSQLQTYARQLSRAGLRGDALTESLEAMGIAAQVQGDRGAARFRALAINARLTGGSVADLAERYRNRLGPIARRQMLSLDNQTTRFRRNVDRIFDGLDLEGALGGLDQVLDLFSQNTASGRAMRSTFASIFQPMLDAIGELAPIVRAFIEGMIIAGLKLQIAFLEVRNALRETFGGTSFFDDMDAVEAATTAGIVVMGALAVVVLALAIVFGLAAAALLVFIATLVAVPLLIGLLVAGLVGAISEAIDFWSEVDWGGLADDMIDGLVDGITGGARAVGDAMRSLATGASNAFRSALGISSPSTVFAGFGVNLTEGLSQGVEAGSPAVEDSVSGLVETPGGAALGGATSITIGDVHVSAGETDDPRGLAEGIRDALAEVLEGVQIEMGAS